MSTEIANIEDSQIDRPYDRILEVAISQGAPLDQLEKWMELKRKHESDEARKAFFKAVAAFKREEIIIKKDKLNNQFKSKYSSLGNLLETVNPFLGKHGLSVSFNISQTDKIITCEAILRHELGHTDSVSMSAPPDTSGGNSKNPIQQIKSTFTYLRSATFEAVTGLSGTEASFDDDGNSANPEISYITEDQQIELNDKVKEVYGTKPEKFWKYLKVEDASQIRSDKYQWALKELEKVKKRMQGGQ